MAVGLYIAAYGDPILVDAGLMAGNGKPLQFRGLCPLLLKPSERSTNAEVTWSWDGAGVEPMSDEPDDQIIVTARVTGPVRWRKWSAWVLKRTDVPPQVPSPVAYYEEVRACWSASSMVRTCREQAGSSTVMPSSRRAAPTVSRTVHIDR